MLTESAKNLVPKFFDETGTTYDGVVSYGTLGKDKYWKRKILEQISDGISFFQYLSFPNVPYETTPSYVDPVSSKNLGTRFFADSVNIIYHAPSNLKNNDK